MSKPTKPIPPLPQPDPFLNFEQALEYLGGVKASTMREWTRNRRITSYKPGKQVSYRRSHLDAFMSMYERKSWDSL